MLPKSIEEKAAESMSLLLEHERLTLELGQLRDALAVAQNIVEEEIMSYLGINRSSVGTYNGFPVRINSVNISSDTGVFITLVETFHSAAMRASEESTEYVRVDPMSRTFFINLKDTPLETVKSWFV